MCKLERPRLSQYRCRYFLSFYVYVFFVHFVISCKSVLNSITRVQSSVECIITDRILTKESATKLF